MSVEQEVGFDNPWALIDADLEAVARAWSSQRTLSAMIER
jgi:hypothetical protein